MVSKKPKSRSSTGSRGKNPSSPNNSSISSVSNIALNDVTNANPAAVESPSRRPASRTSQAPSGSAAPKTKERKKRGKNFHSNRAPNYKPYIMKVLRQVHGSDHRIGRQAMEIMNNMMNDLLEKLSKETETLLAHSKKITMSSSDVQTAVRLLLPGELAKHATSEGTKAVTKYVSSFKQ